MAEWKIFLCAVGVVVAAWFCMWVVAVVKDRVYWKKRVDRETKKRGV